MARIYILDLDKIVTFNGEKYARVEFSMPTQSTTPRAHAPRKGRSKRKNDHTVWTSDDLATLTAGWNDGTSTRKLAQILHRTPKAIGARVHFLRANGTALALRYALNKGKGATE